MKFVNLIVIFILSFFLLKPSFAQAEFNFNDRPEVKDFIHEMVSKYHFKESELIALFKTINIRPIIGNKMKAAKVQKPWNTYQLIFVNDQRINQGVEFWNQYEDALTRAEKQFGIPASIIVATIGIETKYGSNTGKYLVIEALVNLAFGDSPRAPYFRKELREFLLLSKEEHLDPLKIMGSYAGAIGQPQFMPSSYRKYAVNFSGNPNIDLSNNEIDVIGSIANYYKQNGWQVNQPIAIPASVDDTRYHATIGRYKKISLSQLIEYGFVPDTVSLKNQDFKVLSLRGNYGNEFWLGFHNFDVIKRYNHSDLYAMAVYQLGYFITVKRANDKKLANL